MPGYGPASYGDGFADVYDDWYADVSDVAATVAAVAELSGAGPVLELGVGTGRLALPLAARGVETVGVDASTGMLERLAAKDPGASVATVVADMALLPFAAGRFAVAFAAFNTFFNLTDDDAQRACVAGVHAALRPHGAFVVEGFVPPPEGLTEGGVSVREVTVDRAVVTVSRHEATTQTIRGQHIEFSDGGVRMRPWMVHYQTPSQLDALLADAGFVLETRHADWSATPFHDRAYAHVSVYRRVRTGSPAVGNTVPGP